MYILYIFCCAIREFNAGTDSIIKATTISFSQERTKVSLVSLGVRCNSFFQNKNFGVGYLQSIVIKENLNTFLKINVFKATVISIFDNFVPQNSSVKYACIWVFFRHNNNLLLDDYFLMSTSFYQLTLVVHLVNSHLFLKLVSIIDFLLCIAIFCWLDSFSIVLSPYNYLDFFSSTVV